MQDNYLFHNFNPLKVINRLKFNEFDNKNILFLIKEFPKFDQYEEKEYIDILNKLRISYFNSPKPKLLFDKDKYNIVIHIRRGNPQYHIPKNYAEDQNKSKYKRWVLNEKYINIMKNLKKLHSNIQFWIFSDSLNQKKDFPEFKFLNKNTALLENEDELKDDKIKMMIRTNSQEAFHHFTQADVLVMSKSSFSLTAGLYNKNKLYYMPYWDKPLENWEKI